MRATEIELHVVAAPTALAVEVASDVPFTVTVTAIGPVALFGYAKSNFELSTKKVSKSIFAVVVALTMSVEVAVHVELSVLVC